ncbi:AsmA family protein [Desulfosediminicola sp.]|uniref:AsmA family protein n=1 Tax=Desulfosediminicola sp. TaxID=2886825 RepID=UPI003AF210B9
MSSLVLRFIRLSIYLFFFTVLFLLLGLVVLALFRIPLPLTAVKAPIELAVENLLERPVSIEETIELKTSLHPVFAIKGLRIGNPEVFETDTFMYLGSAELELELLPLLEWKIYFSRILVDELTVTLEETSDGRVNWVKEETGEKQEKQSKEVNDQDAGVGDQQRPPRAERLRKDSLVVKELRMQDISFFVHEPGMGKEESENVEPKFRVEQCVGTMLAGQPAQLQMDGELVGHQYSLELSFASLEELIEDEFTWTELQLAIAETVFELRGEVSLSESHKELAVEATVTGEDLSTLDTLVQFDLPPFASFEISGALRLADNVFHLTDAMIKTGSSSLGGNILVTRRGELYEVGVNLESPMIQLNDFIFQDWSWFRGSERDDNGDDASEVPKQKKEESAEVLRRLLDPEVLKNIDSFGIIQAQSVRSGRDELGKGVLSLTIKEGRLAIEPLQLNVPGGGITLQASLKPGYRDSDATLSAKIANFDIGVLARRKDPETEMGGLVNLDVDLQATASTLDTVLERGTGHFDFSGQMKNIKAGAVDLWAVNLVTAMLTSTKDSSSKVNCAVGRWSVQDGILTSDVLFVDTGKIRICGSGTIDFANNSLNLLVQPTPKKAEYFNVATPIEIKGRFDEVKVGVAGGGVLGSAVRFLTSPVFTPLKRIVTVKIPEDGSDVCNMVLGAEARDDIQVPGCN